jgi:glutamine synthetase
MHALSRTGLGRSISSEAGLRQAQRFLPDNIYDALADFCAAEWMTSLLGDEVKNCYADLKKNAADRCSRLLGTFVKAQEVQYHHEVYNQYLWNLF